MRFENKKILSPFYIKTNVSNDFKLLRDEILDVVLTNYNHANNNDKWWGCNTDEQTPSTDHSVLLKELDYDKIAPIYEKYINEYNKQNLNKEFKVKISDIWYMAYGKGKGATFHQHSTGGGSYGMFSGIHFFKFEPKLHNSVTLGSINRIQNRYYTKNNAKFKDVDYFDEEYTPDVIQDDLIFFPGDLWHKVENNQSNEVRITICFNAKLV